MKLKKILGITGLAVASTVALAACGAGGNKSAKDDKTLTVGVMTLDDTTEPLWDKVKELLGARPSGRGALHRWHHADW